MILEDWLAITDQGRWAATMCGLSAPRQNGKNVAVELRELFGAVGNGERILHTAHQLRTAAAHFDRLKFFFGDKANDPRAIFPELNRRVRRIRSTNGQEGIELINGGMIAIGSRSAQAGRGLAFDLLVCDEAQDMSDEELEAVRPVISASRNPQMIFLGTPPGARSSGEPFGRLRTEALGGHSKRLSWHEYSAPDHADLDDQEAWRIANPGLGIRILWETVEDERTSSSDQSFALERLGMWNPDRTGQVIIPSDIWQRQGDQLSIANNDLAIAIDTGPNRERSSVALAGRRPDDRWHVELYEEKSGVAWVAAYIERLINSNPQIRAVIIDRNAAAASIIDDLDQRRINVTATSAADMAAACGLFYDGIVEGWLVHTDQPQLSYALAVARKRSMLNGQAWAWNRKSEEADITPLVAATLAVWGARHSSVRRPKRSKGNGRVLVV